MEKIKKFFWIIVIITLAVLVIPNKVFADTVDDKFYNMAGSTVMYEQTSSQGVDNGPTVPTTFTITEDTYITGIWVYHWNAGDSEYQTANLKLVHEDQTTYGPFSVEATDGSGRSNVNWYAFPNVTIKAGTYTLVDSNNASWSWASDTGRKGMAIIKKAMTIPLPIQAPDAASLVYDGNEHNAVINDADAFSGGNLPTISYQYKASEEGEYTPAADTKKAGYYKASFTIGEGNDAKTASVEYAVAKKQLTVTGTCADGKEYDGTTVAAVNPGNVSGIVEADEEKAAVEIDTANFADTKPGNGKEVTVTYRVTGTAADNYIAPKTDVTVADIERKQLTIEGTVADSKEYDGTTAAAAHPGTVSGIAETDKEKAAVEIDTANFADEKPGNGKNVTVTYKVTGTVADYYIVPNADVTTADIERKRLTIAGTIADDKIYDGTTAATAVAGTPDGLVGEERVEVRVKNAVFADKNVGKNKTVTVTYEIIGTNADNYQETIEGYVQATIEAKGIAVAAEDKSSYAGSNLVNLTYTADKLCEGDVYTGSLICEANGNKVGRYDILQGSLNVNDGNGGKNYDVKYTKGTYTVAAAAVADDPTGEISRPDTTGEISRPDPTTAEILKKGTTIKVSGNTYVVSGKNTVTFKKAKSKKVKSITIPAIVKYKGTAYKVTAIGAKAFYKYKKLTKVTIGKNVKIIGNYAFCGCTKLKTLTIGASVTSIGDKAFYKCTTLKKVVIPAKVTKIGNSAFEGCKALSSVTIKTSKLTTKTVGSKAFKSINSKAKIKVPPKQLKSYKKLFKAKGITGKKQKIKK